MVVKALVTYTKTHEETVVGETIEEIEEAVESYARSQEIDDDVGDEWETSISEVKPMTTKMRTGKTVGMVTEKELEELPCHTGVVDGELQHISDYNRAKSAKIPESKD